jgi:hypothetical protein
MRLVSINVQEYTLAGHSANGLDAAAEKVGDVPVSRFNKTIQFPHSGYSTWFHFSCRPLRK